MLLLLLEECIHDKPLHEIVRDLQCLSSWNTVHCQQHSDADVGSLRSLLLLNCCILPGDFDVHSLSSPAYCNRKWYVRRNPGNGCDFVVTRSSPESCWDRFAFVSELTVEVKWLISKKQNKWFHSSRVEFPLVRMSANWFLVSMNLNWIRESWLTLWVLETCLIVGLLPLMIIVISASLSSNTYNKTCWWEELTFERTQSILFSTLVFLWDRWLLSMITGHPGLSVVWVMFPKTETIKSHNSRANSPSDLNPASKDMISDSVELCETAVCFLHIQLVGTNVWLPKTHNVPLEIDLESSRYPAKAESWNSPNMHCFLRCFPHGNTACVMNGRETNEIIVCHRLWSISGQFKSILVTFHFCFELVIIDAWEWILWRIYWVVLFAISQNRSAHFFAWPSHVTRPWRNTKILSEW